MGKKFTSFLTSLVVGTLLLLAPVGASAKGESLLSKLSAKISSTWKKIKNRKKKAVSKAKKSRKKAKYKAKKAVKKAKYKAKKATKKAKYKTSRLKKKLRKSAKKRRRITLAEKKLIESRNAKKERFKGIVVIKRDVFKCSRRNIKEMLKGNAPFGYDGQRVNLHHLKQQRTGPIVELMATEHKKNYKVLHRYTKVSEIDRKEFAIFRKAWWKHRALDCKIGRKK
jgi:F0F1-type ATP synthase membrane subunit b/b'